MRSYKGKLTKIQNKKVPIDIKAEVINIIINKSLEYTLGFTALEDRNLKALANKVANSMKVAMKVNSTVPSEQVFASISHEGLNVNHVSLVHDTAIIATALRTYFHCQDD